MMATPRRLRTDQATQDMLDAATLEGMETRAERQSIFGVKEHERTGYTKNKGQGQSKAHRRMVKASRKRNRGK